MPDDDKNSPHRRLQFPADPLAVGRHDAAMPANHHAAMTAATAVARHHVHRIGSGARTMVLAHGFGCDQQMWRFVAPAFAAGHEVLLFDHLGCGRSDPHAYDPARHERLEGYADDVVEMLEALGLRDVVFVGHSVSAMIGALAAIRRPGLFSDLVMIGPSPRYLNDLPHYVGGFERGDIDALAEMMQRNLVGWADHLSRVVIGENGAPERAAELKASFCAADPDVTRRFAAATFLSDNRADLARVQVPTLVLQIEQDAVAPVSVGLFCHEQIAGSQFELMPVTGHCPHLTHPAETIEAVLRYVDRPRP